MIRRTLAIAGAAVLAVGVSGLSGPASADPGAGVAQQAAAVVNEVGVDMNTTTVDFELIRGEFIELRETSGIEPFELDGSKLIGCNDVRSFTIKTFGPDDEIPAGGLLLVANDTYDDFGGPDRDLPFDLADNPDLVQSDGGVRLVDVNSLLVHDLNWGSPVTACSTYDPSGVIPTDNESMNYDAPADSWFLDSPTAKA